MYEPAALTPVARHAKGKLHYAVTDTVGRIQELLTEDGTIVWRGKQQLWGREESANDDKLSCRLRFPGQYEDTESGLHYNRSRYYDSETGQYISADPIGLAGGVNPYGYVSNPLKWLDPLGLCKSGPNETTGQGYHNETYAPKPVKPQDAVNQWDKFLGPGPHTNTHPRTGMPDADRIVFADGTRSIRYGNHEMNSGPTKHHYHEETWTYDPVTNVMNVDNSVVRVPFPK
ncbi:RHS repeat-associated core domain-containing protein [Buttiauxella ferragutiae]|uniref:RHS repeat-associated core domain-containing protein n=1 Tax=Buttiauxella ferragutiae TaxID=82989 RepID=UPI0035267214